MNANATIQCSISESFAQWMNESNGSIALTTYQAGKVALIGHDGKQVTLLMRQFEKPMGLAVNGASMALATRNEVLLFASAPQLASQLFEDQPGRYDALYLPRAAYFTGDINVHDLAITPEGLWVINTRFCCLAKLSAHFSFEPHWKPPFITDIAPEDRCHLNGLAMVDAQPRYVTCLGETNAPGAWRTDKATGGILVDIQKNEIVLRGLSMPHSPRWYKNQLWVLNSGAGELLAIHPKTYESVVVAALPGYLRGLCFVEHYALLGLCQVREKHLFGNLPVQTRWPGLQCGIAIIDLRTGQKMGFFEFTSGCQELYDVQFLPGVKKPTILNQSDPATRQAFTAPEFSYWLRPGNEIKEAHP